MVSARVASLQPRVSTPQEETVSDTNAMLKINSHARWVQPENERIRLVSTHVNRTWSIVIFAAYLYLWSLSLSDLLFLPTPSPSLSSVRTNERRGPRGKRCTTQQATAGRL